MLARWNKAFGVTFVAAAAASVSLLASSPAHALEGVQGRHAIFYPSLELVYQHDDNFFLAPRNEVSASSFIAHAHFAVEVPGARQYLRFEYAPQWRNVNVNKGEYRRAYGNGAQWKLDEDLTHNWTLNAKLKGSSIFGVDINQKLVLGVLETYELDRGRELVDQARESFMGHDLGVDFKFMGSRQGAKIMVGKEDTGFDTASNAPDWFELDAWRLGFEYNYKFAPLTKFVVGYNYDNAAQDFTGKLRQSYTALTGSPSLSSTSNNLWFGFDGELGRTTTGRAVLGFKSLDFESGASDRGWEGVTMQADVTKAFSRWSKLIFNAQRQPYYSGFAEGTDVNTYYIANRASFTFTNQPQGGRVMWTLIGQFQRNGYDTGVLEADGVTRDRQDDIARVRAEIGFHPIEHLSFRLNYQFEERNSNLHDAAHDFDYEDNLVMFQVQFGF